jgi:large subunit ribosomal protein L6
MSRIGKKPIIIPSSVEVNLEEDKLKAKGPKGEDFCIFSDGFNIKRFNIELKDNLLFVIPKSNEKDVSVKWGTLRSRINNLIEGVEKGFSKQLEIVGVGYQASVDGNNLNLKLGYNHPIVLPITEGLEIKVEKNIITVSGMSKEKVGQFSALIKSKRPVEPYKGKGVHYVGERILRKAGKKVTGGSE